jgi:hypothetical protein
MKKPRLLEAFVSSIRFGLRAAGARLSLLTPRNCLQIFMDGGDG